MKPLMICWILVATVFLGIGDVYAQPEATDSNDKARKEEFPLFLKLTDAPNSPKWAELSYTRPKEGSSSYATKAALSIFTARRRFDTVPGTWAFRITPGINKNTLADKPSDVRYVDLAWTAIVDNALGTNNLDMSIGLLYKDNVLKKTRGYVGAANFVPTIWSAEMGGRYRHGSSEFEWQPAAGLYYDRITSAPDGRLPAFSGGFVKLDVSLTPNIDWSLGLMGAFSASRDFSASGGATKRTGQYREVGAQWKLYKKGDRFLPQIAYSWVSGEDAVLDIDKQQYQRLSFQLKF